MWPWEHLAFGYLVYSLLRRIARAGPPEAAEVGCLFVATQLPDLVDKPLGWVLHLAPTGRSVAHSVLVGGPLVLLVLALCVVAGRQRVGAAFAVGYLSHLLGDVLYDLVTERTLAAGFLLWPLVAATADEPVDPVPYVRGLVADFLAFLATSAGGLFVALELALVALAVLAWLGDGAPGVQPLVAAIDRRSGGH